MSKKIKMKTHKDVLFDKDDSDISLNKIMGKEVCDVVGYISTEFGDPVFKISYIAFKDGSSAYAEGEHDMPYLPETGSHEELENIIKTDPDYAGELEPE